MPWEGHDGGIWHIQNLRGNDLTVNEGWRGSNAPVQVYGMDGTDLGMMQVIPKEFSEFMIVTNGDESCLFSNANNTGTPPEFDFGPKTDTSKVIEFTGLIDYNPVINPMGMENWETSNVMSMSSMFQSCSAFNRDISGWDTSGVFRIPVGSLEPGMEKMFKEASSFNQNLSQWCVSNFTSEPKDFKVGADSWVLPQPDWGKCPRGGEDY